MTSGTGTGTDTGTSTATTITIDTATTAASSSSSRHGISEHGIHGTLFLHQVLVVRWRTADGLARIVHNRIQSVICGFEERAKQFQCREVSEI
jgi:hypothetical protein